MPLSARSVADSATRMDSDSTTSAALPRSAVLITTLSAPPRPRTANRLVGGAKTRSYSPSPDTRSRPSASVLRLTSSAEADRSMTRLAIWALNCIRSFEPSDQLRRPSCDGPRPRSITVAAARKDSTSGATTWRATAARVTLSADRSLFASGLTNCTIGSADSSTRSSSLSTWAR